MRQKSGTWLVPFLWVGIAACWMGCSTGVEPSPKPGILEVTLQADPADTSILIVNRVFTVSEGDEFPVTVFQGRAYNDSTYGILFPTPESFREEQRQYNIIEMENGQYTRYTIFKSHLPPGQYERIEFGVTAKRLRIGTLEIPVEVPPEVEPFVELPAAFRIEENRTTVVHVYLKPFKSVRRYRDTYQFIPQAEVVGVESP